MSQRALLRCCASCMWVFRLTPATESGCPQCRFGHYGARYALGPSCYRAEKTQKPWFDRQMEKRATELHAIVAKAARPKLNQWQMFLAARAEIEGRE